MTLAGCGARVDVGPGYFAETSVGPEPGSTGTGCPTTVPANGTACSATSGRKDDNFYCHYFASNDACVRAVKCSNMQFLSFSSSGDCSYKASACVEGADCERVFERDGACIVACNRVCQCGSAGKLVCRSIGC